MQECSQNQLIDFYLIPELTNNLPPGYIKRLQSKVNISSSILSARARRVFRGDLILQPAADIDGKPSSRTGKERAYEGFWSLVDILLPNKIERRYIGLTSNQISPVAARLACPMIVCEKEWQKYQKLLQLASFENRTNNRRVNVACWDIFGYLSISERKFNIFDLDLMSILPTEERLCKWAKLIKRVSLDGPVLIYIANSVGRNITKEEHNKRLDYFISCFDNISRSDFNYRDRRIPIYGSRLVWRNE